MSAGTGWGCITAREPDEIMKKCERVVGKTYFMPTHTHWRRTLATESFNIRKTTLCRARTTICAYSYVPSAITVLIIREVELRITHNE